jgi:Fe-S oxidoreductase
MPHRESGRTYLSKGMLRKARKIAEYNVRLLAEVVSQEVPLVGIEPSAILAFRDEYPELVDASLVPRAIALSEHCYMYDEFLWNIFRNMNDAESLFTTEKRELLLHGHCQQKAIASTEPTKNILSLPKNYTVKEIPSGCCGMAGSFGFEKEHYELSMKIGGLILFPEILKTDPSVTVVAPGTSCRQQIKDGTGRNALHPVEVLFDALVRH